MPQNDWFRNTSWGQEIEAGFVKKLARAKYKSQYLRIQASILAPRFPKVALRLLDQYFELDGDHFDAAQANVDRATAHVALRQFDAAVRAYEAALAREAVHPHVRTQAYVELPLLIARERLREHYDRAGAVLEAHKDRVLFPAERFRWHCAFALLHSEEGDRATAREAARTALAAASETDSGLPRHPGIGLVGDLDEMLRKRLLALAER